MANGLRRSCGSSAFFGALVRNILITVEYDGGAYAGWQTQPGLPTIQERLETELSRIACHPVKVTGSGRTDAGVHALGQTATFSTTSNVPLKAFVAGANSLLPPDISILSAAQAPEWLDARRSTLIKTYRYRIYNGTARSAVAGERAWWVSRNLDAAAMDEAAKLVAGTHDFGAFRSAGCDARHSVRTVSASRVIVRGGFLDYEISGNGFLRNMVRMIAGTLTEVGLGRLSVADVGRLLAGGGAGKGGPTAPAHGLTLLRVAYPHFDGDCYP